MISLTRRRDPDARYERWDIFYGDVGVGVIDIRNGVPKDGNQWGWSCGFYPGAHPRETTVGSAATFEEARAAFERAWQEYLPRRTEADFQEWRDQQAFTAAKYAERDQKA